MSKYIFIDFSKNFCSEIKVIYREDAGVKTEICKKNIIIFFRELLQNLQKVFNMEIYYMESKQKVINLFDIDENFLFYSIENALEHQEFLCTTFGSQSNINSFNDVYFCNSNSLVISNDWDGDGVYFYINPNSDVYLWLLENLNLKKIEIFEYNPAPRS